MNRRRAIATVACLAILVAWLAPGCADLSSMPTEPTAAETNDWHVVHEPLTTDHLTGVWGMDADDVWLVGDGGAILHYDGRTVVRHDGDPDWRFLDIDGCATDEVWAVGRNTVARWDGRRWSEKPLEQSLDFFSVVCEAPDAVYIGGHRYSYPEGSRALIRRYTGRGWKDWYCPEANTWLRKIWRPFAGGPLFAIVADTMDHAYRVDDGRWEPLDWRDEILDADGDLVTMDNHDDESPVSLYRIEQDHTLTPICGSFEGNRVMQSRAIVAGFDRGLQLEFDCSRHTILGATPERILDIAVPERPGPTGTALLVAGRDGMAMVGGWRPDWSVEWRTISPGEVYTFYGAMLGNEDAVFIPYYSNESRGVFVQTVDGGHAEPLTYAAEGMFFLENGKLVAWNSERSNGVNGEMFVRDTADSWRELPLTERVTLGVWGAREDDLVAMSADGEYLRLVGGQWVVQDNLGGRCRWFAAFASDRIFALIELPSGERRILHNDGSIWRDITPGPVTFATVLRLGLHTGTLYGRLGWASSSPTLRFRDDSWEELPPEAQPCNPSNIRESSDGQLYYFDGITIDRLHADGWQTVYVPDAWFNDFAVDPVGGVHVKDNDQRILHHPYRPR